MSAQDILDAVKHAAEFVPELLSPEDTDFELRLAKFDYNDIGNAQRLCERFGRDLMYVKHAGWYGWTGTHWSFEDGERMAQQAAHDTARRMRREAWALRNERREQDGEDAETLAAKRAGSHLKWALQSGNARRLAAMLAVAQPYLLQDIEALDADPFVFNTRSGTLDLLAEARGEPVLRAHRREDRISRISPVAFDPEARCLSFRRFLDFSVPDADARVFLQRYFGYGLTGDVSEQVLLLLHGRGQNGKSTLCDIVSHILGDYGVHIAFASLLHDERRRGGDATPDLARLPGARLVLASEPENGARFSESTVKSLTGGEVVTARHLNEGFFEFRPQFKLLLSANEKPSVRGQDDGIWRRVLLVPFGQKIPEEMKDKKLPEKLRAEASGILNWLLDGARLWLERGLEIPESVREAVKDYRAENDPVGGFIESCCAVEEGANVTAKKLYAAYVKWSEESALQPLGQTAFGRRLGDKGFVAVKIGVVFRRGLRLLPDWEEEGWYD